MRHFLYLCVIFILGMLPMIGHAHDQINAIETIGNQRISNDTILDVLDIHPQQVIQPDDLDRFLKRLYKTGYFSDVKLNINGNTLEVNVVERPTVDQIAFEGNAKIADKILKTQMKLKTRAVLAQKIIRFETQRLLAIYRAKGYFGAKVEPKIIQKEHNRVDVVFEIEEGDPARIEAIHFKGNKDFSGWTLSSIISTKETAFWRFWASDDVFDPDRLEMDREELRKFYLNKGYVDFRIRSATAELVPTLDAFVLNFDLEEGARYKFGKITIDNRVKKLPLENPESELVIAEGEWYSAELVELVAERLVEEISSKGMAFVDVTPIPDVDEKNHVVNLRLEIKEGPRFYLRHIKIHGNTRTIDPVVRREFLLAEGDAINPSLLKISERRLKNLGFFKKVDITKSPVAGSGDELDLNVSVEEQSTGDINFNVGYGTIDGFMGVIRVTERNLFGRGYELGSALELAKRRKTISMDFMNPFFMDRRLALGGRVYYTKLNRDSTSSFSERAVGASVWTAYTLMPNLVQRWNYSLSQQDIRPDGGSVFPLVSQDKGKFIASAIGHELSFDKRNNRFMPSRGYIVSMNNEVTGVGGNLRFLKNMITGAYYYPISEDITFGVDAQYGFLTEMGRLIRIGDKFTLGGQSLRGFDYGGAGPHGYGASATNKNKYDDALGGDHIFTLSAQVNFPLGLPDDLAVSGHVFFDAGTLWDSKLNKRVESYNSRASAANQIGAYNSKKIRASIGVGISWMSPMGMIGLDYGYVLSKAKGDQTRPLLFQLGGGRF